MLRTESDHTDARRVARAETLVAALGWTRDASLALLVGTGVVHAVAPLLGPVGIAHRVLAEVCVVVCLADVAVALVLESYARSARGWLARVGLLALVGAAYVSGFALGADEAGAEGRAHLARAVGADAPAPLVAFGVTHIALALLGVMLAALLARGSPRHDPRRSALAGLAALGLVTLLVLPGVAAERDVPAVDGAEAVRAPWIARALSPLEAASPAIAAIAMGGALATLAGLPLLARRDPLARRLVAGALLLAAIGLASLTVLATFAPPH